MKHLCTAALALTLSLLCHTPAQAGLFATQPAGEIRVTTEPAGATVLCDGVLQSMSPTTISGLSAGPHLIVVEKNGHHGDRRTVSLLENQKAAVEFTLSPIYGLVLVHSKPAHATVDLDGSYKGRTPLLIHDIPLGAHKLNFQIEGYLPRTIDLTVDDRIPQKVDVELQSDAAQVICQSEPVGATVILNGSLQGETPLTLPRISSGEYQLQMRLAGYRTYSEKLLLQPGDEHTVTARLEALPASLRVVSEPSEAWVYVDNQRRGKTPLDLNPLTPGTYRIRVDLQGYESDARSITVTPAQEVVEEFRLKRNSGTIELVTEPAGAKVYLDGEYVGMTHPGEADTLSQTLTLEYISHRAPHTLQLTKEGFSYEPKQITLQPNQILSLHEIMTRLFVLDTVLVRNTKGAQQEIRGQLLAHHPNGDIELGLSPTITIYVPSDEILSMDTIREE